MRPVAIATVSLFLLAGSGCGDGGHHPADIPLTASVVAAGGTHSLAVAPDGTVLAWGGNNIGQLGDGTNTTRLNPLPVLGMGAGSGVVALAGGAAFTLALKSDGTVLGWGGDAAGQLGDGTTNSTSTPVPVVGLGSGSGVKAVATGGQHSLALKSDGTVLAWGNGLNGRLGNGGATSTSTAVQVSGLASGSGAAAIAASGSFSLALKQDGTVLAWGLNTNGQLGDGSVTQRLTPTQTAGLGSGSGVIAIAAGSAFSLALKQDGTVLAWGVNSNGELGNGQATGQTSTAAQVSGLGSGSGVIAIAAGGGSAFALKSDGTVLAWGQNSAGQLGDGTTTDRLTPTQVPGLAGVAAVAVGGAHTVARLSDGTVLAWGSNGRGQLGDGTLEGSLALVEPSGLGAGSGVTALAAGNDHALALKSDGTVLAWGLNANGQLGNGTTANSPTPVQVSGLGAGSGVVAIAAGGHSLALKADGTVLAWGPNANGQLGDGTTTDRLTPTQTAGLSGVTAIAAAGASLALKSDGTVRAWGPNTFGNLGDGTTSQRNTPTQTAGASGVVAIEAAGTYSLALKSDGTVSGWGANGNGQLGDGTTTRRLAPVQASALGTVTVTAISGDRGNAGSTFALKSDGAVLAWGGNSTGQLGDGTLEGRLTPLQVAGLGAGSGVTAVRAGGGYVLVLKSSGVVLAVGTDVFGQLGDGPNSTKSLTPSPVLLRR